LKTGMYRKFTGRKREGDWKEKKSTNRQTVVTA